MVLPFSHTPNTKSVITFEYLLYLEKRVSFSFYPSLFLNFYRRKFLSIKPLVVFFSVSSSFFFPCLLYFETETWHKTSMQITSLNPKRSPNSCPVIFSGKLSTSASILAFLFVRNASLLIECNYFSSR